MRTRAGGESDAAGGLSELVPAGHWVIEARMPGGRVAWRDVTLVEGRTSIVVLGP